jgi:glutamate synthase (NADPH/NADH) large chain
MDNQYPQPQGLYHPSFEHDACGIGAIANIKGKKSHQIVVDAVDILINLEHRGGIGAERNTGDGAGILLQVPHRFFVIEAQKQGVILPGPGEYAAGMLFLSKKPKLIKQGQALFERIAKEEGFEFLFWREVPHDPSELGKTAFECKPSIWQPFVRYKKEGLTTMEFERRLYVLRRVVERAVLEDPVLSEDTYYFSSLSARTIVYKGMLLASQLRQFYPDLSNARVETAIALVHSRYSTNTFPSWERAHPNRYIIHNGEINTLRGNINRLFARESKLNSPLLGDDLKRILPVVNVNGSDSAILDNTLEFLTMAGKELPKAVMMTVPEPWIYNERISDNLRAYLEYNAILMEPWDGPAAVIYSDGETLGAVLDRNGLRPSRYYITKDDHVVLSSEVGVLDIDPANVLEKHRLTPGNMLLVDTVQGRIISNDEIKESYASEHPYRQWLTDELLYVDKLELPKTREKAPAPEELLFLQKTFGYSYEDVNGAIRHMAECGAEPIGAMGIDVPLAVLSDRPKPLFDYFKELFAQVTNPPIDALREEVVTASNVYLGTEGNLLGYSRENCRMIRLESPILDRDQFEKIKNVKKEGFSVATLSTVFDKRLGDGALKAALENLCERAYALYQDGNNLLILSDRAVDKNMVPIPSVLALSAVHHHLVRLGVRTALDLIVETGDPREVHHFAVLLGFGASAIYPYLAYEAIRGLCARGTVSLPYEKAVYNYNKAALKSVIKILSKMGISTIQSYQGAQIFEAVGISDEVIDKYFTNTVSRVGGVGLSELQREAELKHAEAVKERSMDRFAHLDSDGEHRSRTGKERHLYNPMTIHMLQQATEKGDYELFKQYSALFNGDDSLVTLRGLMEFEYDPDGGVPLDEVESVDDIVRRFKTGAMSYGSISREAHEALAIAMNRLQGKSNTGEGGEDPDRFIPDINGDSRMSAIKQVASGRFGVTSEYLVNAKELQIKMAQGAKPGEGGQLPASKVYPWVANTRGTTPGVGLISPPPHHDIYSIEDLAQLIYDLKNSNDRAGVSVKLVSEAGVGTIAAGVSKGGATVILISGHDGGTGASPRNSIKHAGLPWELGLSETHQILLMNNLRERVRVETDGKLMTGRDVVIAAMLGADEFGFATAPLVALGCVMMRVCNLDTCPVGIATQNEELRKRFKGKPEYVVNFMRFIAQEMREYMAKLGFRTVNEMIGRVDKLKKRADIKGWKARTVDLKNILDPPGIDTSKAVHYRKEAEFDHRLERVIDSTLFMVQAAAALERQEKVEFTAEINNINRTVGTILGSNVSRKYPKGLPEDTVTINCHGSGGQSFGAFLPRGITINVEGDANDYFGKGLSGGKLSLRPPRESTFVPDENIVVGNVALYGATGGKAFINGVAGERFCVRNSGVHAVVEGVGDHGCEYMTGGVALIIGRTGINFAAGMSGGVAYLYEEELDFASKINFSMVKMLGVDEKDLRTIKAMLTEHAGMTGSPKARRILKDFENEKQRFHKIMPNDYEKMLTTIEQKLVEGLSRKEAEIEAFYENCRVNN